MAQGRRQVKKETGGACRARLTARLAGGQGCGGVTGFWAVSRDSSTCRDAVMSLDSQGSAGCYLETLQTGVSPAPWWAQFRGATGENRGLCRSFSPPPTAIEVTETLKAGKHLTWIATATSE